MVKHPSHFLKTFLPLAIGLTGIFATLYVTMQQNYRQLANDPQIQMAEDDGALLEQGIKPEAVTPGNKVNLAESLAPFVIVFDKAGKPLTSSALLDNNIPTPPTGVFDYTRQHGQDRLTWQPKTGVRIATVIKSYNNGYVLAGRSLKEVEMRENNLTMMVGIGYIVTVIATAVICLII